MIAPNERSQGVFRAQLAVTRLSDDSD